MKMILDIRVLSGMNPQQFVIPLDMAGPVTLEIKPGQFGIGSYVSIIDEDGSRREWFAHDILGLRFEL